MSVEVKENSLPKGGDELTTAVGPDSLQLPTLPLTTFRGGGLDNAPRGGRWGPPATRRFLDDCTRFGKPRRPREPLREGRSSVVKNTATPTQRQKYLPDTGKPGAGKSLMTFGLRSLRPPRARKPHRTARRAQGGGGVRPNNGWGGKGVWIRTFLNDPRMERATTRPHSDQS